MLVGCCACAPAANSPVKAAAAMTIRLNIGRLPHLDIGPAERPKRPSPDPRTDRVTGTERTRFDSTECGGIGPYRGHATRATPQSFIACHASDACAAKAVG